MTDVETTRPVTGEERRLTGSPAGPTPIVTWPGHPPYPHVNATGIEPIAPAAPPFRIGRAELGIILNRALLIFSAAVLAFAFFLLTPSALQHGRTQAGLVRRFRAELLTTQAPVSGVIPSGAPVALIEIPAIGVHEIVVQGTRSEETRSGPGHLAASVMPGQLGNSVIFGRRVAYGGPFRRLPSLRAGDEIRVTTGQGISRYSVVSEGAQPAASAKPMLPTSDGRLTLVTSDPELFANRYRVAVARLESDPFTATGHAAGIARADLGLTGDPSATPTVFVWLLFAALVGAVAVMVFRRAPRATAWLVVAPLVLVAAWLVFENLVVLLPATL